jgi:hypothetical protein
MVTALLNETGIIGKGIELATTNITGSLFLTLLCIVILIFALFFMVRLPLELTAILILPLLILLMSFSVGFITIGGIFLIYVSLLIAGNFFLK